MKSTFRATILFILEVWRFAYMQQQMQWEQSQGAAEEKSIAGQASKSAPVLSKGFRGTSDHCKVRSNKPR